MHRIIPNASVGNQGPAEFLLDMARLILLLKQFYLLPGGRLKVTCGVTASTLGLVLCPTLGNEYGRTY